MLWDQLLLGPLSAHHLPNLRCQQRVMLPVLNLQAPVGVERFVFRAPCILDDTSLTFWSGMSGTTDPGHALPGRVAASESSSTGPDTSTLMKKPAAKTSKKKTEEEEPVGTDHEPLGGKMTRTTMKILGTVWGVMNMSPWT